VTLDQVVAAAHAYAPGLWRVGIDVEMPARSLFPEARLLLWQDHHDPWKWQGGLFGGGALATSAFLEFKLVYFMGGGLDIFAVTGMLMLIGLSAKNAILHLDFVAERIGKMPFVQALLESARCW
jgi:hypothetical protein